MDYVTQRTDLVAESAAAVDSSSGAGRALPPNIDHSFVVTEERHKVDTLRRCIYAADAQRLLVFMNFQQRLKVPPSSMFLSIRLVIRSWPFVRRD